MQIRNFFLTQNSDRLNRIFAESISGTLPNLLHWPRQDLDRLSWHQGSKYICRHLNSDVQSSGFNLKKVSTRGKRNFSSKCFVKKQHFFVHFLVKIAVWIHGHAEHWFGFPRNFCFREKGDRNGLLVIFTQFLTSYTPSTCPHWASEA